MLGHKPRVELQSLIMLSGVGSVARIFQQS
jgi:hypothetical protein